MSHAPVSPITLATASALFSGDHVADPASFSGHNVETTTAQSIRGSAALVTLYSSDALDELPGQPLAHRRASKYKSIFEDVHTDKAQGEEGTRRDHTRYAKRNTVQIAKFFQKFASRMNAHPIEKRRAALRKISRKAKKQFAY